MDKACSVLRNMLDHLQNGGWNDRCFQISDSQRNAACVLRGEIRNLLRGVYLPLYRNAPGLSNVSEELAEARVVSSFKFLAPPEDRLRSG
jgi:hypothetical protein